MDNMLFFLISSCLFLAIIWEALGIFFLKKDVPCFVSYLTWIVFGVVEIFGTRSIYVPIFRLLFDICSSFCLCCFLYHGTIRKKLMWIVSINLLGMISETIVGLLFIFLGIKLSYMSVLGSFISKIILLMILVGLKLLNYSRLKRDIRLKYWCVLFCIPLGSIFILNTIFMLCEESESKNSMVLAMISSAFILAANFMIFHIYEKLSERMEVQKQQIIFDKQIELCKIQIREREESKLNIRNMKHDIENHLICIREYLERCDLEYAKKYVDDLLHGGTYFNENTSINSGNIVVDALLNYKFRIMQQHQIVMINHIEIPYDMQFNDADICIILGNCLDNSIEAVSVIQDIRARYVKVELVYRKGGLLFQIENPFIGKIIKDTKGNFVTTKKDVENHGIGLNSVSKAVKKYNGHMEIVAQEGVFRVQILLYATGENYI